MPKLQYSSVSLGGFQPRAVDAKVSHAQMEACVWPPMAPMALDTHAAAAGDSLDNSARMKLVN